MATGEGDAAPAEDPAAGALPAVPAIVLFADVVDYDRLLQVDESRNLQRVVKLLRRCADEIVPSHAGRCLQRVGDGLIASFDDARAAVRCAEQLHAAAEADQRDQPLSLRIGIFAGELYSVEGVAIGRSINLAERLSKLAQPSQTIVSSGVRDAIVDGLDSGVEDLGECHVKHDAMLRAYRVTPARAGADLRSPVLKSTELLRPLIAVLPFGTVAAEGGQQVLGDVLAGEVIAVLSRVPELRVISRLSAAAMRDRQTSPENVRAVLGADYVLSGNCALVGTRLRLSLELADTRNADVLWAHAATDTLGAVLAGDSTLVAETADAICSAIVAAQVRAAQTAAMPSLSAYTMLFAGIGLMHRTQRGEFDRARDLLTALTERLPRHPVPRAWLAAWHVFKVTQGWFDDLGKEAQLARGAVSRALDCDPDSPLALAIHGLVLANLWRDLDTAWKSYDRAIDLNPSESLARLHRGTLAAFEGRGTFAVDDTRQALELSPLDPWKYYYDSLSATAALSACDYPLAEALARRSLRANRLHASTWRALAIACAEQGKADDARAAIDGLLRLDPGLTVSSWYARSPSARFATGARWADALRRAGLPP